MKRARMLVAHVISRTVGFASVGASIVFGFAISAAIAGAYLHAGMFLLFCIYLVSLAEVAANPLIGNGCSKTYRVAWAVIIALPFVF